MDSTTLFMGIQNKLPKPLGWYRKKVVKAQAHKWNEILTNTAKYAYPIMQNEDIKAKLDKLSPQQLDKVYFAIQNAKLKSPAFIFLVYNFLLGHLGIARFAIGDVRYGAFRLVWTLLVGVCAALMLDARLIMAMDAGAVGLALLDLMVVGVYVRNQNLEKVNQIIDITISSKEL